MALFSPTLQLKQIFDITPALLEELDIKALLLDVDNTLAQPGTKEPVEGAHEWIAQMRAAGIDLHILSNAKTERITAFAAQVGLPFFSMSMKPLPFKIRKAAKSLAGSRRQVALVGDQVFTDVIGGNLAGIQTILLQPFELESALHFRIKRCLERPIRRRN